ncbi:MAG: ribosomal protein S18-alanine N-acetyltransferase [Candidatus Cloacimonetes bacterium]|jgi:ribosomal-protein-alanine N-acetyltransferase|nr:ribosomal protein S18-alanine N-acetyltransferase [Candidatus Cloacimonadota bacterium]MCB5287654.1 ribosomal protein S18-alanine N-acetyltransferase [Candidatus Cloacimonadota bacterium]MCK9184633.1 ribosomal protein S18-alanine N-acetyltransferase [Candidatus Cloacimonadota bacterium]MCK9585046.1 ribosomal protein S18-alanine N-acetyltransferase [Candidatus Cloacimonadota bacterium]MDY0229975.1 ribosomal protein S18-alanine N-acetyltransferase [Candidatus Cloacimonadaceae bacterium]
MQRLVHTLTRADLPQVFEIENRSFRDPWPLQAFSEEVIAHARALDVDSVLCGYILYHVVLDEAVILNFAIDPDKCRQGHGEYLLLQSMRELIQSGCTRFFLDVRRSNSPALKLYEKHGFMSLGIRKTYYSDPDEDAIVMGKIITLQGNQHDS